ncbi:bis(5'-adenosyl)-triphosphatase [Nakaseomyces bracarensis]|uniref:bis(5'-adenosyl)-triphosphatase n=1 Tax=Nakaseomyces bracarensis TaxID=273131 RepID=UPI0038711A85
MSAPIYFSKFLVSDQVFYRTKYCYALVNLKPITKGHVLVVPLRTSAVNLSELTPHENAVYFRTVQLIHKFIMWVYGAQSVNIAIQDGPEAGQSVPHLHTHIIPRYRENNIGDAMYERLDDFDVRRDYYTHHQGTMKPDADDDRKPRTMSDMKQEALMLQSKLAEYLQTHEDALQWTK